MDVLYFQKNLADLGNLSFMSTYMINQQKSKVELFFIMSNGHLYLCYYMDRRKIFFSSS